MKLFLIWSALALAGFIVFFIRLRNRQTLYSKFRIRLNIILMLFSLIPTIPALFFIAQLLTESTRVLLLPGLENALRISLETIRVQTEERGHRFFEDFPAAGQWSEERVRSRNISSVFMLRRDDGRVVPAGSGRTASSLYESWQPDATVWRAAAEGQTSTMVNHGGTPWMLIYGPRTDSTLAVASYPVQPDIIEAKNEITGAIRVYATLSLLKETVIEKNLIWALAFLFILALALIASGAARRIAAGISKPVQDLAGGMSRVAEGDLQVTLDTKAKDEFGYLIDRFNAMTADLETGRKKLLDAERLAAWQQVARQISHEVKNSLTPISLSIHRVKKHFSTSDMPGNVRESLTTVEEELRSLELLAGEFSRFAKMPKPVMKPFDLNRVAKTVTDLLSPELHPVQISTRLSPRHPFINGDREQIKRVLVNLIKNAGQASPPGSTITVSTEMMPGETAVRLSVTDKGSGMDDETQRKMFEPYFTSKARGTGLGLAIVQKIIQEHHADIQVKSQAGEGTAVTVIFPAA